MVRASAFRLYSRGFNSPCGHMTHGLWFMVGRFSWGYALSAHLSSIVICFHDEVVKLN